MARRYRRRFRRKPRVRRYRRYRRRSVARKRLTQQTTYTFDRCAFKGTISSGTAGFTAGGFQFSAADVNIADFTPLYDAYKINSVTMMFIPNTTENPNITSLGNFWYWRDYDDSTAPAALSEVMQIQGVKVRQSIGRMFRIKVSPKAALGIYNGSSNVAAYQARGWINLGLTNAPHFGIKWAWTDATVNNLMSVYIKMRITFRGVR